MFFELFAWRGEDLFKFSLAQGEIEEQLVLLESRIQASCSLTK